MIMVRMRLLRPALRFLPALAALLVWALAAGSIVYWLLRLGERAPLPTVAVAGTADPAAGVDPAAVARALGATQATASAPGATDVASRLALKGVLTHGAGGAALIAVDGQPARPLRVGASLPGLEGGWVLQSVAPHAVVLAAGGREARLELPPFSERSRAGDAVAPPPPPAPRTARRAPAPAGRALGVPAPPTQ